MSEHDKTRKKISELKEVFHESGTPHQLDVTKIKKKSRKTARVTYFIKPKTRKVQKESQDTAYLPQFSAPDAAASTSGLRILTTLDPLETYIHSLKCENAVWPVNNTYSTFYIRHFTTAQTIHPSKHYFVTRTTIHFTDRVEWAYRCTCSPSEHELVASLYEFCDISHEDFLAETEYCIHIQAVVQVMIDFDDKHGLSATNAVGDHSYSTKAMTPEIGQGLYTVNNKYAICCHTVDGYGVVSGEPGKLRCITCKYGTTSCSHTSFVMEQMLSTCMPVVLDELFTIYSSRETPDVAKSSYSPKCFSRRKIPYQLARSHMNIIAKNNHSRFEIDENDVCNLKTVAPVTCGCVQQDVNHVFVVTANLITANKMFKAKVYNQVCAQCGQESVYDGTEHCVINMGHYLVSWEVLRNFMSHFLFGRFQKRVFIPNKSLRTTLLMFTNTQKGIPKKSFDEMLEECKKQNLSVLAYFIKDVVEEVGSYVKCQKVWREFLKSLSKPSPVCSLLHPSEELDNLLDTMMGGNICRNIKQMRTLQCQMPVLFSVLKSNDGFPNSFTPLLMEMKEKAMAPFIAAQEIVESDEISDSELVYFPSLPVCRSRGVYALDKCRSKDACNKYSKGHPTLLPGIFTAYCPHGKCYGFQVMKMHESPDVSFTFLRTHFKQAPKIVIYDNACNLHAYCLNRDPLFFKHTWFLIDSLHWCNHKGCSVGYCLKQYPQFLKINSQVVEQSNSLLRRIKNMVSYMNQENFLAHVKFFLWARNAGFPKTNM